MLQRCLRFAKSEVVLTVSFVLALVSACVVPPDGAYAGYIDFRTLGILFSLMLVTAGLQKLRVFRQAGEMLVRRMHSLRLLLLTLVLLCFFCSMFITNDVTLLTFVPFTAVVLQLAGWSKELVPAAALEACAANLGSMLLPMGNPQNLYLYTLTGMSFSAFVGVMLPYALLSLPALCVLSLLLAPRAEIAPALQDKYTRTPAEKRQLALYAALFFVSLLVVLRVLDWRVGAAIVAVCVALADRSLLRRPDYALLFTFVFLFIFIGNMKRIPAVSGLLSQLVAGHEVLAGLLVSQCISNVPAAILLSGFAENLPALLIGVNIGGLGTLIASMASLISFQQVARVQSDGKKAFLVYFTALSLLLIALLLILAVLLGAV